MRANQVRQSIEAGKKAVNGWLTMPNSLVAEALSHCGFDSVTVDMQHGMVGFSDLGAMLQAISLTEATPMVRVPWLDPAMIMKSLDAGAYGLICPMVNSAAEAEQFVRLAHYPPRGVRSNGPFRAVYYGGADYQPNANATIMTLAMIETKEALADREAIIATPDLTGVYIGPSDLSLSLGHAAKLDSEIPEVLDAIKAILASTKAAGKIAGIHCLDASYGKRMLDLGFDLVSAGSDLRLMTLAGNDWITGAKQAAGASGKTGGY